MKYDSKITILVGMDEYLYGVVKRKESCKKHYKMNKSMDMLNIALYWNCEEVKTKKAIREFREMSKSCIG